MAVAGVELVSRRPFLIREPASDSYGQRESRQGWFERYCLYWMTILRKTGACKSLSSGQKQLLAFARSFLLDPGVVIMDEATASVDAESERVIETALDTLLHGRTAIIHRPPPLSTIRSVERILVLHHGTPGGGRPRRAAGPRRRIRPPLPRCSSWRSHPASSSREPSTMVASRTASTNRKRIAGRRAIDVAGHVYRQ